MVLVVTVGGFSCGLVGLVGGFGIVFSCLF